MRLLEPADFPIAGIPAPVVSFLVIAASLCLFLYIMNRRMQLLRLGKPPR